MNIKLYAVKNQSNDDGAPIWAFSIDSYSTDIENANLYEGRYFAQREADKRNKGQTSGWVVVEVLCHATAHKEA